jgi:hypothetical protein
MPAKNSASSAAAATDCRARESDQLGGKVNFLATPLRKPSQAIRAELIGSDLCAAAGYVARGTTPILALCRKLVAAGVNPALPLECYRGRVLAITVASIGQGAGLEINGHGTGFRPLREGGAASLVRKSDEVEGSDPPEHLAHSAGGIVS